MRKLNAVLLLFVALLTAGHLVNLRAGPSVAHRFQVGRFIVTITVTRHRFEVSEEGTVPGTRGTYWIEWR